MKVTAYDDNEQSVVSELDSPFVLNYEGQFIFDNKKCIVTEFIQGGDLFAHRRRQKDESQVKF